MPFLFDPFILAFVVSAVATALLLLWLKALRGPARSAGTFLILFAASCGVLLTLSEAQLGAVNEFEHQTPSQPLSKPEVVAQAPKEPSQYTQEELEKRRQALERLLGQLQSTLSEDNSAWTDDVAMAPPSDPEPSPDPAQTVTELEASIRYVCSETSSEPVCYDKEDILSSLPIADYAFNRPSKMTLGTPETIALVINSSGNADFKEEFDGMIGHVAEGEVPINAIMEAELVGPSFAIKPEGRQRRQLSTLNPTRWDWEVTPKRAGAHQLEVSMYVILTMAGEEISEDKPLAERQVIEVTVSELDRLLELVKKLDPIRAFLYAIIAGFAGLLAWFGVKGWRDLPNSAGEDGGSNEKPEAADTQ